VGVSRGCAVCRRFKFGGAALRCGQVDVVHLAQTRRQMRSVAQLGVGIGRQSSCDLDRLATVFSALSS